MKIKYSGICEKGLVRTINQDAIAMFTDEEIGLFVVADGMGGHENGEIASNLLVQNAKLWWNEFREEDYGYDFSKMIDSLQQMIRYTNRLIYQNYNHGKICGSTLVILFIYRYMYGVINIGDSRCYLRDRKGFCLLTHDDVWKGAADNGSLLAAVGVEPDVKMHIMTDELLERKCFVLCSDGIYKMCPSWKLKMLLHKYEKKNLNEICKSIKDKVYRKGAEDNLSVILVSVS